MKRPRRDARDQGFAAPVEWRVPSLAVILHQPVGDAPPSPIPLSGPLFAGRCVTAGWPEEHEFDAITALRNSETARHRFLDSSPLDVLRNRVWLKSGMRRPYEGLLSIRLGGDFVGAAGWSDWDPQARSLEIGRIMVNTWAVLRSGYELPHDYPGIGADAMGALREFLFTVFDLERMYADVIAGNPLARRLGTRGGGRISQERRHRADGTSVEVLHFELSRTEWLSHREPMTLASWTRAEAGSR
jgi:RimJ/RimL family protein N-acetyltransferase